MDSRPRAQPRPRRSGDLFGPPPPTAQQSGLDVVLEHDETIDRHLDMMAQRGPSECGYPMACANILDRIYDPTAPQERFKQFIEHQLIRRGARNDFVREGVKHMADALHDKFRQYLCQTATDPDKCLGSIDILVGLAKHKFGLSPSAPITFHEHPPLDGSSYNSTLSHQNGNAELDGPTNQKRSFSGPDDEAEKRRRVRAPTEASDYTDLDLHYERLPPSSSEAPQPHMSQEPHDMRSTTAEPPQGLTIRGSAGRVPRDDDPREALGNDFNPDWAAQMDDLPPTNGSTTDRGRSEREASSRERSYREPSYGNADRYARNSSSSRPYDERTTTESWSNRPRSEVSDRMAVDLRTPASGNVRGANGPSDPDAGKASQAAADDWNSHNVSGYGLWTDKNVPDPADEGFHEPKNVEYLSWDERSYGDLNRGRGRGSGRGGRGARGDFREDGRGEFRGARDEFHGRRDDSRASRGDYYSRDRSPRRDQGEAAHSGRGGGGRGARPCRFFNTPRGCKLANCAFPHVRADDYGYNGAASRDHKIDRGRGGRGRGQSQYGRDEPPAYRHDGGGRDPYAPRY